VHQATRVYCTGGVGVTFNHDDDLLMDSYEYGYHHHLLLPMMRSHISDVVPISKAISVWTYDTVPRTNTNYNNALSLSFPA
jgi:hypothetical protein